MWLKDQRKNLSVRALALLFTIALLTTGIPSLTAQDPGSGTLEVCPDGCAYDSIQEAVDAAAPGDTVLVATGSYDEAVHVPAGKDGLVLAGEAIATATINPPADQVALTIESPGVTVYGLALAPSGDGAAILVKAAGAKLRENVLRGDLDVSGGALVDARLNQWDTDKLEEVLAKILAPAGTVLATPFRLPDGTQDPPAPFVAPSGHCGSLGFEPRFFEEAIWCAHVGGVVALPPSTSLLIPTPHTIVAPIGDNPAGNLIDRNRDLLSVHPVTGEPDWAPDFTGTTESLTDLTVCGGEEAAGTDPPAPEPGGVCVNDPTGVVLDAGAGTGDVSPLESTLDVKAAGVTLSGLTIQYTTDNQDRLGIVISGTDATLTQSRVVGNFLPHEHGGDGQGSFATIHQEGVLLAGAGALLQDNEIRNWRNIGLIISGAAGEGNRVLDNVIEQSRWHGIHVSGPGGAAPSLEIRGNTIDEHGHSGIRFGTGNTAGHQIRENTLGLLNLNAVTVYEGLEGATLDVRLNDWGLYDHRLIPTRVLDEGTGNTVHTTPFLDLNGNAEPGLPTASPAGHSSDPATCNAHPDADWDAGAGVCRFLTIQAAVDFSHAGSTVSVPGSASLVDPTPYTEDVTVMENNLGERLDGLTIQGPNAGVPGADLAGRGPEALLRGTLSVGTGSGALTGFTLDGMAIESDGADGVPIRASGTVTIRNNVIDGGPQNRELDPDDMTGTGIFARTGATELIATDNRIEHYLRTVALERHAEPSLIADNHLGLSRNGVVMFEDGPHGHTVEGNRLVGNLVGISSGNEGNTIRDNQILTGGLGLNFVGGGDHDVSGNVLYGLVTGAWVQGTQGLQMDGDHFLATGTGVEVRTHGLTQPSGLAINNANLAGTGVAMILESDTMLVHVDATCNDWGVYTASAIEGRFIDEGTLNEVEYQPFIAPGGGSGPVSCLELPIADFTFDPPAADRHTDVQFTDQSTPGSRPILSWDWDFGDGATSSLQNPTHRYTDTGTFFVVLTVTDTEGGQGVAVKPIVVEPQPPKIIGHRNWTAQVGQSINLTYTVEGDPGVTVDLEADLLPTGATLLPIPDRDDQWRLLWTPGEFQAGVYTIELVATDSDGASTTAEVEITVVGEVPKRKISLVPTVGAPSAAGPGDEVKLGARVKNTGDEPIEVHLALKVGSGWSGNTTDGVHLLQPGHSMEVPVNVTVGPIDGSAVVTLGAKVLGDPDSDSRLTWILHAPLFVSIEMHDTTTGSPITGSVEVTYVNGAGAPNKFVTGTRSNGFDQAGLLWSTFSGRTDADGRLDFSFGTTDAGAQLPGSHVLQVQVWAAANNYSGHTNYQVTL